MKGGGRGGSCDGVRGGRVCDKGCVGVKDGWE